MSAVVQAPPNAPDAERAVLNSIIVDSACLDAVSAIIEPDDFYEKRHRVLFRAMGEMASAGSTVDIVTLPNWLRERELLTVVGGEEYVYTLIRDAFTAAAHVSHAKIVRDRSLRRRAIALARHTAEQARDLSTDCTAVVDDAVRALMSLHRVEANCEWSAKQAGAIAVRQIIAAHENGGALIGVTSGLADLDEVLGGFHGGDAIIVAARPAMGKTAMMLNMARAAANAGIPAGVISGEQPVQQIAMRLISQASKVDASRLRSARIDEDEWPRIMAAGSEMHAMPLWIYDRSAPSMAELSRIARKWRQEHGIRILFVDYLQRVQADRDHERTHEGVAEVAKGIKNLARDLDIPVVALAQVGRSVEQRPNKRPSMSDLSDSGQIEKEADQILMLYRDEVYNAETPDKGVAEILIAKNRHGPTCIVRCAFLGNTMTFSNLASHVDDYAFHDGRAAAFKD